MHFAGFAPNARAVGTGTGMKTLVSRRNTLMDLLALSVIAAVALWQLAVREVYHRGSGEIYALTVLGFAWLAGVLAWSLCQRADVSRLRTMAPRGLVIGMLCLALLQLGALPGFQAWGHQPTWTQWAGLLSALGALFWATFRMSAPGWATARRALLVGALLWWLTPMLLAAWRAPDLAWPSNASPTDALRDRGRVVTIALLLDEMNARDGGVIADELRAAGLLVSRVSVPSVGENTRNVVASLFHGAIFEQAQPCGFTTVCTDTEALDFSRITATRPDIDIAGVAHPYCAIRGLRSCVRHQTELAWFDAARIKCSLWRRFGLALGVTEVSCRAHYIEQFARANDTMLASVLDAPALREGGVLFAHVLLPHPPGAAVTGTLTEHYRDNLDRSRQFVRTLIDRSRASGLDVRILVFSDHPLRQNLWCSSFAPYVWDGCRPLQELNDALVPVITGTPQMMDLSGMKSNHGVFDLIAPMAKQDAPRR